MKNWVIMSFVLAVCPALSAQRTSAAQPFSSNLVLWSYMQQPQPLEQDHPRQQPMPDPTPETQPAANPTPSVDDKHPSAPASARAPVGAPSAETFTGIINKAAEGYVLKVSESTSYKLDNQQQVQQYEGRRVRVTGTLDSSANLIHVEKVEPLG